MDPVTVSVYASLKEVLRWNKTKRKALVSRDRFIKIQWIRHLILG